MFGTRSWGAQLSRGVGMRVTQDFKLCEMPDYAICGQKQKTISFTTMPEYEPRRLAPRACTLSLGTSRHNSAHTSESGWRPKRPRPHVYRLSMWMVLVCKFTNHQHRRPKFAVPKALNLPRFFKNKKRIYVFRPFTLNLNGRKTWLF